MKNLSKLLVTALVSSVAFSSSVMAKDLDVGVNIPDQLGKTFTKEEVSYEKFKGQPAYILVWDSSNERLLQRLLKKTENNPAPVIVMCTGVVKVGSRRKNFKTCEQQYNLLDNDRVTLIKNKKNQIAKSLKIPKTDHLFVVDETGTVIQKMKL
jgi:hypothetical protein